MTELLSHDDIMADETLPYGGRHKLSNQKKTILGAEEQKGKTLLVLQLHLCPPPPPKNKANIQKRQKTELREKKKTKTFPYPLTLGQGGAS